MNTNQKIARVAGVFYFIFLITLIFAGEVRSNLIVYDDAAATVEHIMASPSLFRIAFISDIVSALFFLLSA